MRGTAPVPIPNFDAILPDTDLGTLTFALLGAGAVALAAAVVLYLVVALGWPRSGPLLAADLLLVVAIVVGAVGLVRYDAWKRDLEDSSVDLLARRYAVRVRVGEMLEEYYGIEFHEPPRIPQRGEEPQFGLVTTPDGVKLCWVHTVEAEDRLAVSCGTHDAATSTELPAASSGMPTGSVPTVWSCPPTRPAR